MSSSGLCFDGESKDHKLHTVCKNRILDMSVQSARHSVICISASTCNSTQLFFLWRRFQGKNQCAQNTYYVLRHHDFFHPTEEPWSVHRSTSHKSVGQWGNHLQRRRPSKESHTEFLHVPGPAGRIKAVENAVAYVLYYLICQPSQHPILKKWDDLTLFL